MPAAANQIIRQLCYGSYAYYGWLYPVWTAAFFVCVLAGGRYADRHGKLPVLSVGTVLMGAGAFVFGRADSYSAVVVAALVMGAGAGFCEANTMALISDVFGESRRTSMLNLAQVFFAGGAVAGPIAVSRLLAEGSDWRWAFIGTSIVCLMAATLCLSALARREERPLWHEHHARWRVILRDKVVLVLSLGILLYVGAETAQSSWAAAYFRHELGATVPRAASSVAFLWAGIGMGRAAATWSSRHFSDLSLICWSTLAALVFQGGLLLTQSPGPAFLMVLGLGFSLGPVWPTIVSRAGATHPRQSGAVMGIVVSAGSIGAALFTPIVGEAASSSMGLRSALWICFALLAINFAVFFVLWQRRARH